MAVGIALIVHVALAIAAVVGGEPMTAAFGLLAAFPFGAAVQVSAG